MAVALAWLEERLAGVKLAVLAGYRHLRRRPLSLAMLRMRIGSTPAPGLLLVPQDLRTADPVRADELTGGVFVFAGRIVSAEDPFAAAPPTEEWAEALSSFGWLRHLRAAGTPEAAETARRLVLGWIASEGAQKPAAWLPVVTAERVRAWLAASGLLLAGSDLAFYRQFSRALWRQIRVLEAQYAAVPPGAARIQVLGTLVAAALCIEGEDRLLGWAARRLGRELDRQILPDGGHISRDPGALVGLVLDLLPLRQLFAARNAVPPAVILTAVDRMMPMIRYFQLGDGSLARFNGMGPTIIDQVATALAYDDTRGTASPSARHSGYERLEAGSTIVLIEAGPPQPLDHAGGAHAGCLSFEFSSGRQLVVTNCGAPSTHRSAWRDEARKTAAHSTVTVADRSSARFARGGRIKGALLAGPRRVTAQRGHLAVAMSHDGYETRLGVVHVRNLRLSDAGDFLRGEDVLEGADVPATLRFHLHPAVQAIATESAGTVLLRLAGGEAWQFSASLPIAIEDSVALATPEGPRRTSQLVLSVGSSAATPRIIWAFRRFDRASRSAAEEPEPELPL